MAGTGQLLSPIAQAEPLTTDQIAWTFDELNHRCVRGLGSAPALKLPDKAHTD